MILVHAASFPSFRLCFANKLSQAPVPDTKILPESNVVGVETGGFIRLPSMDAPGTIYVIDERVVRNQTGTCDRLINQGILHEGNDYDVIQGDVDASAPLARRLGDNGVDVIAVTGCASSITLENLGVDKSRCGTGYVANDGTLKATVTTLQRAPTGVTSSTLPVQLYQLSTAVEALAAAADGPLTVSFGPLGSGVGSLGQELGIAPIFEADAQTTLDFDQTSESVYGTHGFRIKVGAVTVDQSLATVQEFSSSNELPTTYNGLASNYALLLLGDPTYPADAGAASTHLGMHHLAAPVLDPTANDAGADAASSADGG